MTDGPHSPALRNLVHAGVFFVIGVPLILAARGGWVRRVDYLAAGLMGCAVLFNLFMLPRLEWGRRIRREGESGRNFLLNPAVLGACFLIFSDYAVFASWAAMACGDPAACLAGRHIPSRKLPWNRAKSWVGLVAFFGCGFCGAYLSLRLRPCPLFLRSDGSPEFLFVWALAVLAAAVGALAESLDSKIDDNVRVLVGVSIVLILSAHFLSASIHV